MPTRQVGNENIILAVIIVDGNIQIFDNKALIKRLHPKDAQRVGDLLAKVAKEDFRVVTL
jgi:predicted ATPase